MVFMSLNNHSFPYTPDDHCCQRGYQGALVWLCLPPEGPASKDGDVGVPTTLFWKSWPEHLQCGKAGPRYTPTLPLSPSRVLCSSYPLLAALPPTPVLSLLSNDGAIGMIGAWGGGDLGAVTAHLCGGLTVC